MWFCVCSKKLYKAFVHYAGLDKHDLKESGTNTINFKEYETLLSVNPNWGSLARDSLPS